VVLEKDKYQTNTTGILDLDCGPAMVVDQILFADFGLSDGSCAEGFTVNSSCSSSHSVDVVKTLCRGQQRCSILIGPKTFGGDPCLGVPKRLAVNVSCTAAAPTPSTPTPAPPALPVYAPRHFEWNISVPVGSTAIVHVPLLGATAASVAVSADGGSAVWENGRFVAGVPGVSAATATQEDSIALACGSGDYALLLKGG
jgi:hypothetical protein